MSKTTKNILVFSRGSMIYSTQRLKYEAQKAGHQMEIIDHLYCRLVLGERGPELYHGFDPVGAYDVVIPRIGNSVTYMGATAVRFCEQKNIPCTISSEGLLASRDKLRCYSILSAHGIQIPRTAFASPFNQEEDLLQDFENEKTVIKLLEGTQGVGVILAENPITGRSILDTLNRLRKKVLVQEYIEESQGSDIRVFVVGAKVVAAMKRQAQAGDFRSNIHRGGEGKPVQLTSEEEELALKSCKIMNLEVAGVDLLRSNRGPLVLEVNPSPGLEGIERATKVNVAREILAHALKMSEIQRTTTL
ncbi:MAG TPA: RimK family alpha-L-glutamate ligase [Saprospiraceae bacterium]|nr:RimK family alpha-L-glutamate ligase [Saprospiraceae bacterium]